MKVGDKTTPKERMKKGAHEALVKKIDKKYVKTSIKEAHSRIKKAGVDFNKV